MVYVYLRMPTQASAAAKLYSGAAGSLAWLEEEVPMFHLLFAAGGEARSYSLAQVVLEITVTQPRLVSGSWQSWRFNLLGAGITGVDHHRSQRRRGPPQRTNEASAGKIKGGKVDYMRGWGISAPQPLL